ncbi:MULTISPECIES: GntR family transcriptional regulator [Mycolicibacter]|uniref:GntR family transcriptional regulator n=1 Tax=Mycolicibacter virginiensis TaxID=1795032 RepID=A0A9X7ILU8_9MYCO|nr:MULTISPECIES: GntR family transcriptional regulator [Mycobacteriaceae]OBG33641.1 GntR family transcriptional regulator [Mycolicibacter heraklionensis]OBJ32287.1 GntR family transcriptional regulator [Mycolicibacter heraklionensis]PQM51478.1 GntR family transcriptional regulator [Mycolicibacter virginiensis]
MPKKYGVKEKDLVVNHIVDLVLAGELRTGDRINRDAIAAALGVSRLPVQQGIDQLEHDGLLASRYHRGVFVERFDEAAVLEQHELHGVLNGIASARAATNPTPRVLAELDAALRTLRVSKEPLAFQEAAYAYRRIIVEEYAGPRLQAAIVAARVFAPRGFWGSYPRGNEEFLHTYEAETAAIRGQDPEAARAANMERADLRAKVVIAELTSRGVLDDASAG